MPETPARVAYKAGWYKAHKSRILEHQEAYRRSKGIKPRPARVEMTDEERRAKHAARIAKMRERVEVRMASYLRSRIVSAVKKGQKAGSAVADLGCTVDGLRAHLESKFQPGMVWENWGRGPGKWHIDHVRPLASFDLTDRAQFLQACHYTNLQPLWGVDNIRKGARWDDTVAEDAAEPRPFTFADRDEEFACPSPPSKRS